MQEAADFEVGDKATLLCKSFVTMGARTSPPLVLLLMLVEMTLGVIGFWALVTPVLFCSFFMGESMNPQRVSIPSNMITLTVFESNVFHMLPSDVDPQVLCGTAYLITYGAGSVSLPHSAQDSWSTTVPVFLAGIYVQNRHKLVQMVMLIFLHPLGKCRNFNPSLTGLGPGWHLDVGPGSSTNPAIPVIFPTIPIYLWILLHQTETRI